MKKVIIYIASVIFCITLGFAGMYALIYFYPTIVVDTINKNEVTISDTGIKEGVKKVFDSVVVVEGYNQGTLVSTGTGFFFYSDDTYAYIMTNHHVIEDGKTLKLIFNNEEEINATLVGSDQYADIAVLKIKKTDSTTFTYATIGKSADVEVGDTVFTIGAPMGADYAGTVTRGILSGKNRLVSVAVSNSYSEDWIMNVMQTDAAINPGNSGGPLCNVNGEVIGINSLKVVESSVEGLGFSIPIEDAIVYAMSIISGKTIERPYIGIEMIDVSESYALMRAGIKLPSEVKTGVVVASAIKGGPAADGGLKSEDIIVKVGNIDVETVAEFRYYLYKYAPGDKVEITFYRNGKLDNKIITLTKSE